VHYVQSLRVNAQIATLKQAGLTDPGKDAGFCTSSIPWLLAACNKVVLPIISFCSVDAPPDVYASGAKVQLSISRAKIWASLSDAADRQQIDNQVLNIDQPKIPAIATHIINDNKAINNNRVKLP
jgi:hypothetical protein